MLSRRRKRGPIGLDSAHEWWAGPSAQQLVQFVYMYIHLCVCCLAVAGWLARSLRNVMMGLWTASVFTLSRIDTIRYDRRV